MDLGEALRTRLLEDTNIAAKVETRVFWQLRKQGSPLPAIVLTCVDSEDTETIEEFVEPVVSDIDVNIYAASHSEAWAIARLVKAALTGAITIGGDFEFWPAAQLRGPRDGGTEDEPGGGISHRAIVFSELMHSAAT